MNYSVIERISRTQHVVRISDKRSLQWERSSQSFLDALYNFSSLEKVFNIASQIVKPLKEYFDDKQSNNKNEK